MSLLIINTMSEDDASAQNCIQQLIKDKQDYKVIHTGNMKISPCIGCNVCWLKFIFQYIYYIFETVLVTLILVFAQKAFEKWFHKENIPYGGIILALTWGIGHFFTKDIVTGILCIISGFAFGSVYLLTNRDIRKTFPLVLVMFVL